MDSDCQPTNSCMHILNKLRELVTVSIRLEGPGAALYYVYTQEVRDRGLAISKTLEAERRASRSDF